MSLGQFYTRKEDSKQFKMYKKILNGIILTEFDKKTGVPYSNDSYQIFVTKDDEWEMGEAEDIFYFLKDGVTPILKKMLLEAQNEV